jgi:hypothetical protein
VAALRGVQLQTGDAAGRPFNPERYQSDMEAYRGSDNARTGDPPAPEPRRYSRNPFPVFPGEEGEYFVKLLTDLEADGVKVLLVGLPDFIATYRTDLEQDRYAATIGRLAAAHSNCVFINYDDPKRFPLATPEYFQDGRWGNPNSHLSKKGVAALLPIFLPDLEKALGKN